MDGEKKLGERGGSEDGRGDKIPGNELTWQTSISASISSFSIISESPLVVVFSLSWIFAFSIVASRAAGEIAPSAVAYKEEDDDDDDDEEEEPVRRCTKDMKSSTWVWITLGETA